MAYRQKPPRRQKRTTNPVARAVRSTLYRPRVSKNPNAYRRKGRKPSSTEHEPDLE